MDSFRGGLSRLSRLSRTKCILFRTRRTVFRWLVSCTMVAFKAEKAKFPIAVDSKASRKPLMMRSTLMLLCALLPAAPLVAQTQHGIEVSDLDRKADPCNDFYQFANGTWRAQNPIPASMDRWSRRWAAGEANKDQLKQILDAISAKPEQPKGSVDQLIGDFYSACTNEAAVNQAGVKPLQPLLADVDGVHDRPSLVAAIIAL